MGLDLAADLGQFLTSPGFGGGAALLAAYLAFRAAGRRLTADVDVAERKLAADLVVAQRRLSADLEVAEHKLSADREAARAARWWDTLSWIYERATSESLEQRLSTGLSISLFDRLLDEAQTELEALTAQGLIDGLLDLDDSEGDGSDDATQ